MKQYIWFHPFYVRDTSGEILQGQIENAKKYHYLVLQENELGKVKAWDHLTIVGHSTPPQISTEDKDLDHDDTGLYIQGETAEECLSRLLAGGLRVSPKILSMECCRAAIPNGIAHNLSIHPFFKNCLIEASRSGIGRNPGTIKWVGLPIDDFGRAVICSSSSPWVFLLAGKIVAEYQHRGYELQDIIRKILPEDFHDRFFCYYNPGFFLGRAGRHCFSGSKLTFEQATIFANDIPDSASSIALEKVMGEMSLFRI